MAHLLTDQLRLMAAQLPDERAYLNLADLSAISFGEWEEASNRAARGLVALGVAKGDRVGLAIPMEDPLRWLVAYAAIHKAGAVAVPVNTRLAAAEVGHILAHSGASVALTGGGLTATVASLRAELPALAHVVDDDEWAALLDHDGGEFQVPVEPDDMADILYTSGTTGRPKGVVVRHRNAAMIPNAMPNWTGQVWMHASPLFTFAGIASVYNPMKLGMTGAYMPRFDAGRWLALVAELRPAAMFIVPAMAQLLLAHPDFAATDFSCVTLCSVGSAPVAPETLRRLAAAMPNANVTNGYGMTEAGPAYCTLPREELERRPGSVGKPMPPAEFRIVDEAERDLPPGEIGEVLIRNPGRQREYYNDPEATAAAWNRDGWLRSGDLGYLDADGYLYIVGRKKDVIIRGGNNVHAKDVEDVLYAHPAVLEAAVAAVPHEVLGEDVGAWVVLRPGATATAEELQAHCAASLADYKVPRRITFMDALPRNPTGKVQKDKLPR
jgi:acyl-CoA synthetase (AMP-forming)/AMP-acid ligase II